MVSLHEINQKPKEYMQHVEGFANNPKGFFLISGSNGNGKTFTSQALYDRFWHPMSDNQFWNQSDLKIKWQDSLAKFKSANYVLEQLVNAPLLVLDDVGTVVPTEAFLEFLYVLIDKRWVNRSSRGTIITTNLNSTSMREKFGDAFVSRVASGRVIRHDGPDRRPVIF